MSVRYCLMACERESSVLADANGVKKNVDMKTTTIAEVNWRQMCFMFALLWIVVGRHTFVYISSYHRISTEEMECWHRALKISECGSRIADCRSGM